VLIYIASAYTLGDTVENIRKACLAGDEILAKGHTPFVPHLSHLYHFISPKPWETWLKLDAEFLARCDALLRLEGISKGADLEVEMAKYLEMPIYYSLDEIPQV